MYIRRTKMSIYGFVIHIGNFVLGICYPFTYAKNIVFLTMMFGTKYLYKYKDNEIVYIFKFNIWIKIK